MKKSSLIQLINTVFGIALLASYFNGAWAEDPNFRFEKEGANGVSIFYRGKNSGANPETISLSESLSRTVNSIYSNRFFSKFRDLLPGHWAITVDSDWNKSEGYYSPEIQAPGGLHTVIVQRQAVLDETSQVALVAHELTHLIHWDKRANEETWVREGLALLAELKISGKFNRALESGFTQPETSLTVGLDFHDRQANNRGAILASYGHVLQYFYYLDRNCGGDDLMVQLLTSSSQATGKALIAEILAKSGNTNPVCRSFTASFHAFEKARFAPQPSPASAYVLVSNLRAHPSVHAPGENEKMLPDSARAYLIKSDAVFCAGEKVITRDGLACLEIKD